MKSLYLIVSLAMLAGCAGGSKSAKKDSTKKAEAAKAAAVEAQKQMDDQLEAVKKEESAAKEEVAEKKEVLDKSKAELAVVRARLKKMGFAAEIVPVTRQGDVFTYQDGSTKPAIQEIKDADLVTRLNEIVENEKNKNNDAMDFFNTCSGGFETCVDGQMYLLFMNKPDGIECRRMWYLVDENCQ